MTSNRLLAIACYVGLAVCVALAVLASSDRELLAQPVLHHVVLGSAVVVFALSILMHPLAKSRGTRVRVSLVPVLKTTSWWALAVLVGCIAWIVVATADVPSDPSASPGRSGGCRFRAGSKSFAVRYDQLRHHPERVRVLVAFDGVFLAMAGVIALSGARERDKLPF